METSILNRKPSLIIGLSAIILFLVISCYSQNYEMSESNEMNGEDVKFISPNDINTEFPGQAVGKLKDVVTNTMLPTASGKKKEELNKILKYLNDIQKDGPTYFEDSKNTIEFLKTGGRASVIFAELHPKNFSVNRNVSSYYINIGHAIEDLAQSEEDRKLGDEFKKNGIQAAKDLVENFPDNGLSYAQLAFSLSISGGDKKKIADLFKRCVELDKKSDYCKNSYNMMIEEIGASSP